MREHRPRLLTTAFLGGAIADAAALLPMLSPRLAGTLWGLRDTPATYTAVVVIGLMAAEGWGVRSGVLGLGRMTPTFLFQAFLLGLFLLAFFRGHRSNAAAV